MLRLVFGLLLLLSIGTRSDALDAGSNPDPVLELSSYAAGQSAAHRLSFQVSAGELETYRVVVTYAPGFRFKGFDTQGPAGSPVGTYELDVNLDGVADRVMPVHSIGPNTAYIDIIPDNVFSPDLEPALNGGDDTTLQLRLPFGGDANAETRVAPFGARVTLLLYPNIIVNPSLGGNYPVVARLTTVDPDTDGADDGAGAAPETMRAALTLGINGPVLAPFARLRVDDFDLRSRGSNRDRFTASGRYVLGATSDGIDVRRDSVTVSFASFSQTIPPQAFVGNKHTREYRGVGPGVRRLRLRADGHFEIDVRRLHLITTTRPQTLTLGIGNDVGEATVMLPHNHRDDHR